MAQPRVNAAAPPLRPPRYGFLVAAEEVPLNNIDGGDANRWIVAGYEYEREQCSGGGRTTIECEGLTGTLNDAASTGLVDGDPFLVYGVERCSTFGFDARDWTGRANRLINGRQSYEVANEVWEGTLGLAQRHLAHPSSVEISGALDIHKALACVEMYLADTLHGAPGMIHLTFGALTMAYAAQAVWRDGNLWRTVSGHVVVADAGYTGTGPNGQAVGTTQWIYGTGLIQYALGPVEIIPGTFEDARSRAAAIDRTVNDVVLYVQRPATWVWDECAHVACEVNVADCTIIAS